MTDQDLQAAINKALAALLKTDAPDQPIGGVIGMINARPPETTHVADPALSTAWPALEEAYVQRRITVDTLHLLAQLGNQLLPILKTMMLGAAV